VAITQEVEQAQDTTVDSASTDPENATVEPAMDRLVRRSMNQEVRVGRHRLYGGMRLRDYPCDVFYDNPLFSELIYPNPGNDSGNKTWGRFVRQTGQANRAFVPAELGTRDDYLRLEREWQRDAHSTQGMDSIWGGWRDVYHNPDLPWLIVCPRDPVLQYWYATSLRNWLAEVTAVVGQRQQRYEIRHKQDRKHRIQDPATRIIHTAQRYRGVITAHSVSAIDAVLAGRPAVIWGQDPTLGMGTPWTEFAATGQVREPRIDQVQIAAWTWAKTTYPTLDTERAVECIMK
jgi:hypothetical protein